MENVLWENHLKFKTFTFAVVIMFNDVFGMQNNAQKQPKLTEHCTFALCAEARIPTF